MTSTPRDPDATTPPEDAPQPERFLPDDPLARDRDAVTGEGGPEPKAPQWEAPQWEAPQWEAPQWEAPRWETPANEPRGEGAPASAQPPGAEGTGTPLPGSALPAYEAPVYEAPVYEAPVYEVPLPSEPAPSFPPYGAPAPGPYPGAPPFGPPPGGAYPPPGPGGPYPGGPGWAPPTPPKTGLAVSALVLGVLALLGCLIPVFGLILALVAFGFGIAALVKKQPFGFAVTGLALGSLATIAALIMTAVFGIAISGDVLPDQDSDSFSEEYEDIPEGPDEITDGPGSWQEPLSLGEPIVGEEWTWTVTGVREATEEVLAANAKNLPMDGYRFLRVEVTGTYAGPYEGSPYDLQLKYRDEDGLDWYHHGDLLGLPDLLWDQEQIDADESMSGAMYLEVPLDDHGLLVLSESFDATYAFIEFPELTEPAPES